MATHSSPLAWKIPWMEEPGRLQSMGLQRVRHDWVTSMSMSMLYYFVVVFPWVWVKIIVYEVLSQLWLPSPRKNVPVTILIWSRPPADHPDCCSVTELLIWRPRVFPIFSGTHCLKIFFHQVNHFSVYFSICCSGNFFPRLWIHTPDFHYLFLWKCSISSFLPQNLSQFTRAVIIYFPNWSAQIPWYTTQKLPEMILIIQCKYLLASCTICFCLKHTL